jgi:mannose/fructose/N-acetylgalactosamine-specific phosphotransferase system component IIC
VAPKTKAVVMVVLATPMGVALKVLTITLNQALVVYTPQVDMSLERKSAKGYGLYKLPQTRKITCLLKKALNNWKTNLLL